ncbi:DNA adenine methylase [Planomicrobium okeanokoites]|uniref:DNA adenine methylase n=1 Tax=Planomicrobium okeanokoites TaxID=244 RepID=UPI002491BFBA|nr:DNA adenine methylase [Planomicrobium okeanokoites]
MVTSIAGMDMLTCRFCEETAPRTSEAWQLDKHDRGFWCETCDGFTFLDEETNKRRFTLILEDKTVGKTPYPAPALKLSKRLSPYRYPGGKSKVIDYLHSFLQESKSKTLVSPFTGGGSFELAMLESGVVQQLHLNDLDTGVFSFWWTVKHMPYELIYRLETERPTHKDYFKAQALIKNDYIGANALEAAWASLLVNRLAYSGISKANPLGGRSGCKKVLLSRWNPADLIRKVERIHALSDRIEITNMNATELIEETYWDDESTIFIDPPYVQKGKDLYHCYYREKDHIELCILLDSLYHGMPGADIILTYDYEELLTRIYEYPEVEIVGRHYSA